MEVHGESDSGDGSQQGSVGGDSDSDALELLEEWNQGTWIIDQKNEDGCTLTWKGKDLVKEADSPLGEDLEKKGTLRERKISGTDFDFHGFKEKSMVCDDFENMTHLGDEKNYNEEIIIDDLICVEEYHFNDESEKIQILRDSQALQKDLVQTLSWGNAKQGGRTDSSTQGIQKGCPQNQISPNGSVRTHLNSGNENKISVICTNVNVRELEKDNPEQSIENRTEAFSKNSSGTPCEQYLDNCAHVQKKNKSQNLIVVMDAQLHSEKMRQVSDVQECGKGKTLNVGTQEKQLVSKSNREKQITGVPLPIRAKLMAMQKSLKSNLTKQWMTTDMRKEAEEELVHLQAIFDGTDSNWMEYTKIVSLVDRMRVTKMEFIAQKNKKGGLFMKQEKEASENQENEQRGKSLQKNTEIKSDLENITKSGVLSCYPASIGSGGPTSGNSSEGSLNIKQDVASLARTSSLPPSVGRPTPKVSVKSLPAHISIDTCKEPENQPKASPISLPSSTVQTTKRYKDSYKGLVRMVISNIPQNVSSSALGKVLKTCFKDVVEMPRDISGTSLGCGFYKMQPKTAFTVQTLLDQSQLNGAVLKVAPENPKYASLPSTAVISTSVYQMLVGAMKMRKLDLKLKSSLNFRFTYSKEELLNLRFFSSNIDMTKMSSVLPTEGVHSFLPVGADVMTFKVNHCRGGMSHNSKTCPDYHNHMDRRRNPQIHNYRPVPCKYVKPNATWLSYKKCKFEDTCRDAHSQLEITWHPHTIKNTVCHCKVPGCHFHHLPKMRFDLTLYKTVPCLRGAKECTNLSTCHFYHHDGDRRRNPKEKDYNPSLCENLRVGLECTEDCRYCHNEIELDYHRLNYKKKKCEAVSGQCSKGYLCPYIHSDESNSKDMTAPGEGQFLDIIDEVVADDKGKMEDKVVMNEDEVKVIFQKKKMDSSLIDLTKDAELKTQQITPVAVIGTTEKAVLSNPATKVTSPTPKPRTTISTPKSTPVISKTANTTATSELYIPLAKAETTKSTVKTTTSVHKLATTTTKSTTGTTTSSKPGTSTTTTMTHKSLTTITSKSTTRVTPTQTITTAKPKQSSTTASPKVKPTTAASTPEPTPTTTSNPSTTNPGTSLTTCKSAPSSTISEHAATTSKQTPQPCKIAVSTIPHLAAIPSTISTVTCISKPAATTVSFKPSTSRTTSTQTTAPMINEPDISGTMPSPNKPPTSLPNQNITTKLKSNASKATTTTAEPTTFILQPASTRTIHEPTSIADTHKPTITTTTAELRDPVTPKPVTNTTTPRPSVVTISPNSKITRLSTSKPDTTATVPEPASSAIPSTALKFVATTTKPKPNTNTLKSVNTVLSPESPVAITYTGSTSTFKSAVTPLRIATLSPSKVGATTVTPIPKTPSTSTCMVSETEGKTVVKLSTNTTNTIISSASKTVTPSVFKMFSRTQTSTTSTAAISSCVLNKPTQVTASTTLETTTNTEAVTTNLTSAHASTEPSVERSAGAPIVVTVRVKSPNTPTKACHRKPDPSTPESKRVQTTSILLNTSPSPPKAQTSQSLTDSTIKNSATNSKVKEIPSSTAAPQSPGALALVVPLAKTLPKSSPTLITIPLIKKSTPVVSTMPSSQKPSEVPTTTSAVCVSVVSVMNTCSSGKNSTPSTALSSPGKTMTTSLLANYLQENEHAENMAELPKTLGTSETSPLSDTLSSNTINLSTGVLPGFSHLSATSSIPTTTVTTTTSPSSRPTTTTSRSLPITTTTTTSVTKPPPTNMTNKCLPTTAAITKPLQPGATTKQSFITKPIVTATTTTTTTTTKPMPTTKSLPGTTTKSQPTGEIPSTKLLPTATSTATKLQSMTTTTNPMPATTTTTTTKPLHANISTSKLLPTAITRSPASTATTTTKLTPTTTAKPLPSPPTTTTATSLPPPPLPVTSTAKPLLTPPTTTTAKPLPIQETTMKHLTTTTNTTLPTAPKASAVCEQIPSTKSKEKEPKNSEGNKKVACERTTEISLKKVCQPSSTQENKNGSSVELLDDGFRTPIQQVPFSLKSKKIVIKFLPCNDKAQKKRFEEIQQKEQEQHNVMADESKEKSTREKRWCDAEKFSYDKGNTQASSGSTSATNTKQQSTRISKKSNLITDKSTNNGKDLKDHEPRSKKLCTEEIAPPKPQKMSSSIKRKAEDVKGKSKKYKSDEVPSDSESSSKIENKKPWVVSSLESLHQLKEFLGPYSGQVGVILAHISQMYGGTHSRKIHSGNSEEKWGPLLQPEVQRVLELALRRLSTLLLSGKIPPKQMQSTRQAIREGQKLIQCVQEISKEIYCIDLNIPALSKALLGKDTLYMKNVIDLIFQYHGKERKSPEAINNIIIQICSEQLKISSLSQPKLSSKSSIQSSGVKDSHYGSSTNLSTETGVPTERSNVKGSKTKLPSMDSVGKEPQPQKAPGTTANTDKIKDQPQKAPTSPTNVIKDQPQKASTSPTNVIKDQPQKASTSQTNVDREPEPQNSPANLQILLSLLPSPRASPQTTPVKNVSGCELTQSCSNTKKDTPSATFEMPSSLAVTSSKNSEEEKLSRGSQRKEQSLTRVPQSVTECREFSGNGMFRMLSPRVFPQNELETNERPDSPEVEMVYSTFEQDIGNRPQGITEDTPSEKESLATSEELQVIPTRPTTSSQRSTQLSLSSVSVTSVSISSDQHQERSPSPNSVTVVEDGEDVDTLAVEDIVTLLQNFDELDSTEQECIQEHILKLRNSNPMFLDEVKKAMGDD